MQTFTLAGPAADEAVVGALPRGMLLIDLRDALAVGAEPTVLVIFQVVGLQTLLDALPVEAAEILLARLTLRLADELGRDARAYRPRREEFAALLPVAGAERKLDRARSGLVEAAKPYRLSVLHGSALLPAEATSEIEALERVDERLFTQTVTPAYRRRGDRVRLPAVAPAC